MTDTCQVRTDWSREELQAICARAAATPMKRWHDRDSLGAIKQVGACWALLAAGCPFRIRTDMNGGGSTVWVEFHSLKGFGYFEVGELDTELIYLPTPSRLDECEALSRDWY